MTRQTAAQVRQPAQGVKLLSCLAGRACTVRKRWRTWGEAKVRLWRGLIDLAFQCGAFVLEMALAHFWQLAASLVKGWQLEASAPMIQLLMSGLMKGQQQVEAGILTHGEAPSRHVG